MLLDLRLSDEEKTIISEAEQLRATRSTAGWGNIRNVMGMYVQEALKDMEGAELSSNDRVRSNLQLRYTTRKDFVQMVDNYLSRVEEMRKETLREIAQANGYSPTEAFDFAIGDNNG